MVKISELKLRLEEMSNEQEALYQAAAKRLGVKRTALNDLIITKKALMHGADMKFGFTIRFWLPVRMPKH